jgi:hypothetical protein
MHKTRAAPQTTVVAMCMKRPGTGVTGGFSEYSVARIIKPRRTSAPRAKGTSGFARNTKKMYAMPQNI